MDDQQDLLYSLEGGVATLVFNRPRKLNSFTADMLKRMIEVINEVAADDKARVFVISGVGRAFCTGADVKDMEGDNSRREGRLASAGVYQIPVMLQSMEKPVIAAVNGIAAGGGMDLACACDIRIASEKATFSSVFVRRGLMPTLGGTYFLPRLVGLDKAFRLIWTGDMVDAREAERIGLVTEVVPHDELEIAVKELAAKLIKGPPLAIAKSKHAVIRGMCMELQDALNYVRKDIDMLRDTEDHREAVNAFLEKREPVFKGR